MMIRQRDCQFSLNVRVFAYAFDDASIFQLIAHIKAKEIAREVKNVQRKESKRINTIIKVN